VAERDDLLSAWKAALEADPVSAFGGVVAINGEVDDPLAGALASLFLEVIVASGYTAGARRTLAAKSNLRLLVDEGLAGERGAGGRRAIPDPTGSIRTAGGAVLVTTPDVLGDDPAAWKAATRRAPDSAELADLDLAWRIVRGVTSNAIVLVRDRRLLGIGSGQTSRVDAARQAVEKARHFLGPDSLGGAVCASDAFFPFPDSVEVCLEAGVRAFVQPGGSIRDAEAVAAADAAQAAMVMTGVRHFRH
jgi:phosphoribosylaminoimidazolecarboxamide formyltransferase/IMP cyclohydrolase